MISSMVAVLTVGSAFAAGQQSQERKDGMGKEKVTVCHKGKNTLGPLKPAAKKHLENHKGDYKGACNATMTS